MPFLPLGLAVSFLLCFPLQCLVVPSLFNSRETAVSVSVVNISGAGGFLSGCVLGCGWYFLSFGRRNAVKTAIREEKGGDRLAALLSVDQQLQRLGNVGIFVPVFVPDIGNGYGSAFRSTSIFDGYQIAIVGYFETFVYIVAVEVDVFRNPPRYRFHIRAEFRKIIAVFTVCYRNHIVY